MRRVRLGGRPASGALTRHGSIYENSNGKITYMEDEPTIESIIRKLREIVGDCEHPNDVPDPEAPPVSEGSSPDPRIGRGPRKTGTAGGEEALIKTASGLNVIQRTDGEEPA
jgi:hypothetical protein